MKFFAALLLSFLWIQSSTASVFECAKPGSAVMIRFPANCDGNSSDISGWICSIDQFTLYSQGVELTKINLDSPVSFVMNQLSSSEGVKFQQDNGSNHFQLIFGKNSNLNLDWILNTKIELNGVTVETKTTISDQGEYFCGFNFAVDL